MQVSRCLLSVPCVRVECLQLDVKSDSISGLYLSVPCVRVECLQLTLLIRFVPAYEAFSTLCSGRVFATAGGRQRNPPKRNFQYPVFGSSVCNPRNADGSCSQHGLSVPCVRVECLQRAAVAGQIGRVPLSVPCVRVECLQLPTWRNWPSG